MKIITSEVRTAIEDDKIKSILVTRQKRLFTSSRVLISIIWDGGQSDLNIKENEYSEELDKNIVYLLNRIGN